jgi:hypothetical protein
MLCCNMAEGIQWEDRGCFQAWFQLPLLLRLLIPLWRALTHDLIYSPLFIEDPTSKWHPNINLGINFLTPEIWRTYSSHNTNLGNLLLFKIFTVFSFFTFLLKNNLFSEKYPQSKGSAQWFCTNELSRSVAPDQKTKYYQ